MRESLPADLAITPAEKTECRALHYAMTRAQREAARRQSMLQDFAEFLEEKYAFQEKGYSLDTSKGVLVKYPGAKP